MTVAETRRPRWGVCQASLADTFRGYGHTTLRHPSPDFSVIGHASPPPILGGGRGYSSFAGHAQRHASVRYLLISDGKRLKRVSQNETYAEQETTRSHTCENQIHKETQKRLKRD